MTRLRFNNGGVKLSIQFPKVWGNDHKFVRAVETLIALHPEWDSPSFGDINLFVAKHVIKTLGDGTITHHDEPPEGREGDVY